MARVNIVKRIKVDGRWVMRSIPRKQSGNWDWNALPEGRYYVEWYDGASRKREPAGTTACQALEVHRRRRHQLEAEELGYLAVPAQPVRTVERPLDAVLKKYLEQIETLKKPNTHRKYEAVLERFAARFPKRSFESISVEEVNVLLIDLMKHGMQANTVLHNAVIIAQFFKRHGRGGLLRELQLPERSTSLPREYTEAELARFFAVCDNRERALFSTFLMTGFREQEAMYLFWSDLRLDLRTARVTAKRAYGFSPKRCEEREVPISAELVDLLKRHPATPNTLFVFPSPTGNREQHMLDHCKQIAERAGLNAAEFDLKTFRSTYATRMLRSGFDVRTVQHWMGHKSLETTMRYLVPAKDVQLRLDQVTIPGVASATSVAVAGPRRKRARSEETVSVAKKAESA